MARSGGIGECCVAVQGLHHRPSDFIHKVVVHRREEAIRGWRSWLRENPLVHPRKWLRPDLGSVILFSLLGLLILPGLMRNSEKPGFPVFVALGKGRPALRNLLMSLRVGCLTPGGFFAAPCWRGAF